MEGRLINAEALKAHYAWWEGGSAEMTLDEAKRNFDTIIDVQQTVVAKVLRCKDCRWYENAGFHTNCKKMQFCVEAEDYCSRWERREDAKTD